MKIAVDILCVLTSLACAGLLLRGYLRTRFRLLLWAGLCFAWMLVGNVFLLLDEFFYDTDLSLWRKAPPLVGLLFLLYGMILEES